MKKIIKKLIITSTLIGCFSVSFLIGFSSKKSNISDGLNISHVDDKHFAMEAPSKFQTIYTPPKNDYVDGRVLVKTRGDFDDSIISNFNYKSYGQISDDSNWYKIDLESSEDTIQVATKLASLNIFERIDFDYVFKSTTDSLIASNPYAQNQSYLTQCGIIDAWKSFMNSENYIGGDPNVIVAVIDTGVDYNHIDLRDNVWLNYGEIPNNGVDDDNNGYIDDYRGWDFVTNDSDPMDDNGHGTHVAGIIGAKNNNVGIVGVAYNCKVMALKAANSKGELTSEDIAKAIRYAYLNGASVINMSFGGSTESGIVTEALEEAYYQCVLVAAAGNESSCNNLLCGCLKKRVTYPAALPYVIGVMSCDALGQNHSSFSNYDHYYYQGAEYNVYACGENIISTYPNNKFMTMSGTSMATPIISGMAALLRSKLVDRNTYSTKYLTSQVVSTGHQKLGDYHVANIYDAFNSFPKPDLNFSEFHVFDSLSFSSLNNNDRSVDAGETIHVGIDSFNISGVASNIKMSLSKDENDGHGAEEFAVINNPSICIPDVGTYSTGTGGYVYDGDDIVDYEHFFEIKISQNCPNNIKLLFNVSYEYQNGMDNNDTTIYKKTFNHAFYIVVNNGEVLSGELTENIVLNSNKRYIVKGLVVPYGLSLTINEGVELEMKSGITVYGSIVCNGTEEKPITFINNFDNFSSSASYGMNWYGAVDLKYVIFEHIGPLSMNTNIEDGSIHSIDHCYFNGIASIYNSNVTNSYANSFAFYNNKSTQYKIENNKINYFYLYLQSNNCNLSVNANLINSFSIASYSNFDENSDLSFTNNVYSNLNCERPYRIYGCSYGNKFFNKTNYSGSYIRDSYGRYYLDLNEGYGEGDYSTLWPFITNFKIVNGNNEEVHTIGGEAVKFLVEFNTAMKNNQDFHFFFGTRQPWADTKVTGEFVSDNIWESNFKVTSEIDDGLNIVSFNGVKAISKNDLWFNDEIFYVLEEQIIFTIDLSHSLSMNLFANPTIDGVILSWNQDDYDTLMGYNVYRSEHEDGNFVKLNSCVIPAEENSFIDDSGEPGKEYWYTFTVVLSDMSESKPAGKICCRAVDTVSPIIYHTPINQGYENVNLLITCTASDNIAVKEAILHYRTFGDSDWKIISMNKENDRYSAIIFGNEVTLKGIEYFITVDDGHNIVTRGNEDNPFYILIKEASNLIDLGDVDGDGTVTTKDALMIIRAINDELILTDDQFKRADLNKDNVLSTFEALRILQYINGNVNSLEM